MRLPYDKFANVQDFTSKLPNIRRRATNRILLHYFPEFYSAYRIDVRNKAGEIPSAENAAYQRVRTSMNNPDAAAMSAAYFIPHNPALRSTKHMVLVTLDRFNLPLTSAEVTILKDSEDKAESAKSTIRAMQIPDENETWTVRTTSPKIIRDILALLGMFPLIEESLLMFNADEGISSGTTTTSLVIGSLMETNNLVNDGLSSFQRQIGGFEGALPLNLDFNFTQQGMMQILNNVVTYMMKDLTDSYNANTFTMDANQVDFTDADLLIITFGRRSKGAIRDKPAISSMSYVVNEVSFARQPLRTGYLTNILYNSEFSDPLIIATLKNYQMLVRVMETMSGPNAPNFSFVDFLSDTPPGDFGLDSNFVWDDLPQPVDTQNMFLREAAKHGVIDLTDVKNLENGFKLALSPAEMREYRQKVRDNPEIYKKVIAANKAKGLKAARDISKGIEGIFNGNFPGVKKNSKLGILLRKIGIDQLAKEAMICLTFGLAPAFARLARAVQGAITEVGLSIYEEPGPPKNTLTIPEIDLSFFEIFTIDGKIWPEIRKMLINSLMEAVLEIVKGLADLLKELCALNNPLAEDFGENDLADLVNNNLSDDGMGLPTISNQSALNPNGVALTPLPPPVFGTTRAPADALAQVFGRQGLSYDQVMQYLRDLSAILSSMEICFLFTNREEVTYETLEKILDFNLEYPDLQIRSTLNTHSAIIGFFANLSRFVDLTDFCNQIANTVFLANVDNLCLLEEAAPDRINDLLEKLAEGLIPLSNPAGAPYNGAARAAGTLGPHDPGRKEGGGLNLLCPARAGFIENPLFNDTIPGLLATITRIIEEDFVNSVGSAQQALKEPGVSSNSGNDIIAETLRDTGNIAEGAEEMSKVGKQILEMVAKVFGEMGSAFDYMQEFCDVGEILGVEAEQVEQVVDVVIDVMNELLNDPEFAGALAQIESTIEGLADQNERTGGAPPAVTYDFPAAFTEKFNDYIHSEVSFDPKETFTSLEAAKSTQIVSSGEFSSTTPSLFGSAGYTDYKASHLRFNFPTNVSRQWRPVPGQFYGTGNIPRFERALTGPDVETDALVLKFPTKTTVDSDPASKYIDISLKSALLPNYEAAMNFGESTPPSNLHTQNDTRNTNPYVSLFADELLNKITFESTSLANDTATRARIAREIDTVLFPAAYGGLVESAFAYIEKNGIFDIDRLNSLNFFHDNSNCIAESVADLLDVSSILNELNNEMLDALCYDADSDGLNPMGTKIREVIRYGLFLLLVQIHVAQFIIKNIFVFSAFDINHIMGTPMVKEFMSITIRQQIDRYLQNEPEVRQKMVEYFNKKILRPRAIQEGGLVNALGEVVFPEGMVFQITDFSQIVEFITTNRLVYSKLPVSNAVKSASPLLDPKPFNKAFIEDMLTIQPGWFGGWRWGDVDKDQAYIYVRQNPLFSNTKEEYGKYQTERRFIRSWGTETQDSAETSMLSRIRALKDNVPGIGYGKLVIERQVVWDSVESTDHAIVPPIIRKATGQDYGLELDLFKSVMFSSRMRRATGGPTTALKLRFQNLNLRYNVVYYLPEAFDESDTPGPEKQLFAELVSSGLSPHLKMNFGNNITFYRIPLKLLDAALPVSNNISTTEVESKFVFDPDSGQYQQQDVPILKTLLEAYNENATNSELLMLVMDPSFEDYFGKTFNRDLITLIPVMHNFYLTTSFFPKFDRLLLAPKARCVELFLDTIRNEDAVTNPSPRPGPQARAARQGSGTSLPDNLQQSALEFILKMLIETPINILRGVSEMLDPHVAISKLIRDITGFVFFKLAEVIDMTPPIEMLRGPVPAPTDDDPAATIPGIAPGISGEGVLKLLFCLLTIAMEKSGQGFQLNIEPPDEPFPPPSSPDVENFLGDGLLGVPGAVLIGNPPKNPFTIPGGPGWEGLLHKDGDPDPRDPRNLPGAIQARESGNFYPRINIEGVDFTGTFLGLLMLPPGPFGIVYLLLMLLKGALEDALGADSGSEDGGMNNVSEEESGSEC